MVDVLPTKTQTSLASEAPNPLTQNSTPTAQCNNDKECLKDDGNVVSKKLKKRGSRKRYNPSSPPSSSTVISNTTNTTKKNTYQTSPDLTSSSFNNNESELTSNHSTSAPLHVSDDESDAVKRRRDRNQREQERSQRIASQIADLKDLLSQSNVAFKPDKYSTLVSVHQHIESLQRRGEDLDREHKGLLDTIAGAGEIVNQGMVGIGGCREEQVVADQVGSSTALGSTPDGGGGENEMDVAGIGAESEADMGDYVQGLDYKSFFFRCTVAMCVASIDGRLLECNNEFIKICGLTKEVLDASGLLSNGREGMEFSVKSEVDVTTGDEEDRKNDSVSVAGKEDASTSCKVLSLFNLLSRDDMGTVFEAMSTMLRSQSSDATTRTGAGSSLLNHWTGVVDSFSKMKRTLRINITLVRQKCGTPKYFNCAVTPCA